MKSKIIYGVIPAVMFSMGTSQVRADYAPIDCSTAKDDIATLQHEKKKTSDKAVGGILAFTPIGLVANAATGEDKMDKDQKLSAEEYNKKIDAHIARIKAACPDALSADDSADY